jgi:hypothetical protein
VAVVVAAVVAVVVEEEVVVAAAEVAAVAVAEAVAEVLRRLRLFLRRLFRQARFRRRRLLTKRHQRHCRRIILAVRTTTLFVSRALVNQCLQSLKTHHVSQRRPVQLAMQLLSELQPDLVQQ